MSKTLSRIELLKDIANSLPLKFIYSSFDETVTSTYRPFHPGKIKKRSRTSSTNTFYIIDMLTMYKTDIRNNLFFTLILNVFSKQINQYELSVGLPKIRVKFPFVFLF